ncbi:hypothetical protein CEXT_477381 [Caerostris extrusa]|uniref:Uncharacterized protein n=1 Tax=Caerostris extrusa TaxID=172846 RepID=A0AAV4XGJ3_CAEEX|nr:hypothetical protein CEXT_477381 [Caerostris extrusa]
MSKEYIFASFRFPCRSKEIPYHQQAEKVTLSKKGTGKKRTMKEFCHQKCSLRTFTSDSCKEMLHVGNSYLQDGQAKGKGKEGKKKSEGAPRVYRWQ